MSEQRSVEVIANDIQYIRRDVEEIKTKLDKEYVTQDQFEPVKKLVFGMVSILLTSVIVGILTLVLSK